MSMINELQKVLQTKSKEELIDIAHGLYGVCAFTEKLLDDIGTGIDLWETLKDNLDVATEEARPLLLKAISVAEEAWALVEQSPEYQAEMREEARKRLSGDN